MGAVVSQQQTECTHWLLHGRFESTDIDSNAEVHFTGHPLWMNRSTRPSPSVSGKPAKTFFPASCLENSVSRAADVHVAYLTLLGVATGTIVLFFLRCRRRKIGLISKVLAVTERTNKRKKNLKPYYLVRTFAPRENVGNGAWLVREVENSNSNSHCSPEVVGSRWI